MKKLLLLGTAVALMASAIGAGAQSNRPTRIVLLQRLDQFSITRVGDDYFAQQHVTRLGNESFGVGMTASTPDIYKGIMVTDFAKNGQYQDCYDFEYPFHNGGHWTAYRTVDGKHVKPLGWGKYNVITY